MCLQYILYSVVKQHVKDETPDLQGRNHCMPTSCIPCMDNLADNQLPDPLPNKYNPQSVVLFLGYRLYSKVSSKAKCKVTYKMKKSKKR